MTGEFERIDAIVAGLGSRGRNIGDDAAVLAVGPGRLIVSVDSSVEGVHFRFDWLRHEEAGWRAAAAALSDLAAEGARPAGVLAALVVPAAATDAELLEVMEGIGEAAAHAGASVVGGDLSRGPCWIVSVTVLGWAERPVSRAGALPGDGVWVTGVLGAPRAAVETWSAGRTPPESMRRAFVRPEPRIAAGRWLAAAGARAMLDLSDGLGGDAGHLARASGVEITLDLDRVPVSPLCTEAAEVLGLPAEQFAAEGGEDYELLAVLPPAFDEGSAATFAADCGLPLTRVGDVTVGSGVRALLAGRPVALRGYDHFR